MIANGFPFCDKGHRYDRAACRIVEPSDFYTPVDDFKNSTQNFLLSREHSSRETKRSELPALFLTTAKSSLSQPQIDAAT